jgi:hypothetical protein
MWPGPAHHHRLKSHASTVPEAGVGEFAEASAVHCGSGLGKDQMPAAAYADGLLLSKSTGKNLSPLTWASTRGTARFTCRSVRSP